MSQLTPGPHSTSAIARGERFAALLIVSALLASSCAARTAPVLETPPLSHLAQLQRDVDAVVADPVTEHAVWAISATSLRTGETIYRVNGSTFMRPASSHKLVTAAVAAERLGWRYRFETRLVAMGPIEDGRLLGDLVVVGNGDPTINPRHPERFLAFDDWARQLRRAGVRLVEGDLVGDDRAFAQPGWGSGWMWDDLRFAFGAPAAALLFNEGQVEITAGPGMTPGAPAIVTVSPADSGLLVASHVVTGAAGTTAALDVQRLPASRLVDIHGSVPLGGVPVAVRAAVENPTLAYLGALESALARNDIFVKGRAVSAGDLPLGLDPAIGRTLVVDHSPPLRDIVDVTLKWSRNGYAEALLRAMDLSGRPATAEEGLARVRETLSRWGIDAGRYVARDGSGLSSYNLVAADTLTALLTHTWMDPALAELFFESLPVAGHSGTLAGRLKDTPAEGRVHAKTGTFSDVRSLSGYLRTLDDEPIVFSILVNNFRLPTSEIDRRIDEILLRLVTFQRR